MINGLISIGYNDIWDDYDTVNPLTLLEGIPTVGILDFIVERFDEVLFAFSDTDTHRNRLYEMRCFIKPHEKSAFDKFITLHKDISLFSSEGNFWMYKLSLQVANTEDRKLNNEDIYRIYKAYLYCNQKWSSRIAQNLDNKDLNAIFLRINLPIVEFKLYKDFRVQLYKAVLFFNFCENDENFGIHLASFCEDRKVKNWREYLLHIFSVLESCLKCRWIKFDENQKQYEEFFKQFSINLADCSTLWNNNDLFYLRDHFLYTPKSGLYLLLNYNLLVDKFYQGMKFDFCKSILSRGGCDEKGNLIKSIPDFNALLGRRFSEIILFYNLMYKSFNGNYDVLLSGTEMKPYFPKDGEPDFYVRKGRSAFIFEYKDLTLGDKIKFSEDTNYIKKEILDRICKGGKKDRKGGGQILHSIDRIVNKHNLETLDPNLTQVDIFYPIIVTTDRSFSALGVNRITFLEFADLYKKYDLSLTHIYPPIIMDLDTLFSICYRLHENILSFEKIIVKYTSLLSTSPDGIDFSASFYTFVYDK